MRIPVPPLSIVDYQKFMTSLGESDYRYELEDGRLHVTPPAAPETEAIRARLWMYLYAFRRQQTTIRNEHMTNGPNLAFLLQATPPTIRVADIALVPSDERVRSGVIDYVTDAVPSLVVEVIGHRHTPEQMRTRATDWLKMGATVVWLPHLERGVVYVHLAGSEEKTLVGGRASDMLDGGGVLPGFSIPVSALFD